MILQFKFIIIMVNYCCVYGCGRNSRQNKHLNYYSLPKERHRQTQWLKAAGREDLLEKDPEKLTVSHRFCSRHFPPASIKNRHLCSDAVPTLCLFESGNNEEGKSEPKKHKGIICNSCSSPIQGFRYMCVTCKDFDLCQKCEMHETHPEHYMLRLPKPLKYKLADDLLKKWQAFFKANHITPEAVERKSSSEKKSEIMGSDSSDDEPITKYVKSYPTDVDLPEKMKAKIRREVNRVLSLKNTDLDKEKNKKPAKKKDEILSTVRKRTGEEIDRSNKKLRTEEHRDVRTITDEVLDVFNVGNAPEVVFADVNEINTQGLDVKNELQVSNASMSGQPVMHVKLSDDLTQIIIETPGNLS